MCLENLPLVPNFLDSFVLSTMCASFWLHFLIILVRLNYRTMFQWSLHWLLIEKKIPNVFEIAFWMTANTRPKTCTMAYSYGNDGTWNIWNIWIMCIVKQTKSIPPFASDNSVMIHPEKNSLFLHLRGLCAYFNVRIVKGCDLSFL